MVLRMNYCYVNLSHRMSEAVSDRVARLAFFDDKFGFFRGSWRQKIAWLFGFFFSIFGFFGRQLAHILSEWCFGFLNILLKGVIRLF